MLSEIESLDTIALQSQAPEQRLRLTFVHSLGSALDPSPVPSLTQSQKSVVGDPLVRCSSNACWWKPDELAFVGPEGCLQIVHVPSAQRLMYVDNHYFLPGMHTTFFVFGAARSKAIDPLSDHWSQAEAWDWCYI